MTELQTAHGHRAVTETSPSKQSPVKVLVRAYGGVDALVSDQIKRQGELSSLPSFVLARFKDSPASELPIEDAREACAILPAADYVVTQIEQVRAALNDRATGQQIWLLLSAMAEAMPAARTAVTPEFVDAFAFLNRTEKFSVAVLFTAITSVWATQKFAPALNELVQAARTARDRYTTAMFVLQHQLSVRREAEAILRWAEAGDDPIPWEGRT